EHGEVLDGAREVAAQAFERYRLGCQRRVEGEAGDTKPWRTVHGRIVRRAARICVQAYINAGQGPPQVWRWGGRFAIGRGGTCEQDRAQRTTAMPCAGTWPGAAGPMPSSMSAPLTASSTSPGAGRGSSPRFSTRVSGAGASPVAPGPSAPPPSASEIGRAHV